MPNLITPEELATGLKDLPGWTVGADEKSIRRTFQLKDFSEAFSFMTRVALAAEKLDHHPEWSNVWNKVDVVLTTHSAGGITGLDLQLARSIDRLLPRA